MATFFVAHPERMLFIGLVLVGIELALARGWRPSTRLSNHGLSGAALIWGICSVWEWAVVTSSPEANIRVDLLLIYPVLGLATLAGFIIEFRAPRKGVGGR